MTRDEILAMVPGMAMNVMVAQEVMGWNAETFLKQNGWWVRDREFNAYQPFHPSTDISAAWEVVEELQSSHLYTDIRTCADFYEVWIWKHEINGESTETVASPKLPEAIAKCALLAVLDL